MSVYFTSDLHLQHNLAAQKRGFDSISEHDAAVMDSLRSVTTKRTVLWVLGDVAMDRQGVHEIGALPGQLRLVRGNHDEYEESLYRDSFDQIHGFLKYKNLWLSHCPIHPQEMWRCGANVHGHIHKGAATPELPFPYINVNWDFWRRPVSLDEIKQIVSDHAKD